MLQLGAHLPCPLCEAAFLARLARSSVEELEEEEKRGDEEGYGGEEQVPAVRRARRRRGQEALREPSFTRRP